MSPENEVAEIIHIDSIYNQFARKEDNDVAIFLGTLYVYFDTDENAMDFKKKIRELQEPFNFFDADGPYLKFMDSKSTYCSYLALNVYPFPPYCVKKGIDILNFLKNNYALPQAINVSGYDPEKLGTGAIVPSFGQIKLTEINKLELPLTELISDFQISSSQIRLLEAINNINLLTTDTIKIEPLKGFNGKVMLQITCSNESSADALRIALFRLANNAKTYDRIHLKRVKGVAGEYCNDMFILTAKSSSVLEETLQTLSQHQSAASCSSDIFVKEEFPVASCSLNYRS